MKSGIKKGSSIRVKTPTEIGCTGKFLAVGRAGVAITDPRFDNHILIKFVGIGRYVSVDAADLELTN